MDTVKMDKRDITKIDKTILDNFYKLVHAQPNIRLTAASSTFKILSALKKNRKELFNENLNYCIDRLVTGLSSNRAFARRGYGALLLELLNQFQVSTERLLSIAQQKFGNPGKDSTKDSLIGYFLLISTILKSGNHKKSKQTDQYVEKMYKLLMNLVYTKSYFDFSISSLMVEYYEDMYTPMLAHIPKDAFSSDAKISAIHLLAIVLCNKKTPLRQLSSMDGSDLLSLCSVLKGERLQRRPLHPVFFETSKFIIDYVPQHFESFYSTILFTTFFKANHNELASMGLELTTKLIASVDSIEAIQTLMSEHLVKLLILSLRNKTSLSRHCVDFFGRITDYFSAALKDKNIDNALLERKQLIVVQRLTTSPGSLSFDRDSNSDCLDKLLNQCTANVLKQQIERIKAALLSKPVKESRIPVLCSCVKQISYICCRTQLIEDQILKLTTVKYLLLNSLFRYKSECVSQLVGNQMVCIEASDKFKQQATDAYRNAYHSVLCHIVSTCNSAQRIQLFDDLISYCDSLVTDKSIECKSTGNDNENEAANLSDLWTMYMESLDLHRKFSREHRDSKQLFPIKSLFYFYGLQILEHQLECKSQLEELHQSAKDALEGDPNDGSWADILTDQIIAILSATECSPWIRRLCDSVFGSLLPHISQTSIDLLCEAIKTPLEGEDECDDEEDEDMSVEDQSPAMEANEQQPESEEDAEESSDDSDDRMSVDGRDNIDINQKSGSDVEGDGDDEEDEEYLDDEQMLKLDPILADMFKLNRVGKKKRLDPSFKLRCLDLIKKVITKKRNDKETIAKISETIVAVANASRKSPDTRPIFDKINKMLPKGVVQAKVN